MSMLKCSKVSCHTGPSSSPTSTQPYFEDELRLNPQKLQFQQNFEGEENFDGDESPVTESLWLSPNRLNIKNYK